MAIVAHTSDSPNIRNSYYETFAQWRAMGNGDVGDAFKLGIYTDRSVQLLGTLGTGGEMTFEGSLDGTTWFTLKDLGDTAIILSALGGVGIGPAAAWVRPHITNGNGSTSLDVYLYGVKHG